MPGDSSQRITRLLKQWSGGDRAALEELAPVVEAELRRLARGYMRRERSGHTLQTTALINEAYLRLLDEKREIRWQNRAHFFGIASRIMRRVLVDHARKQLAGKRSGHKLALDELEIGSKPLGMSWIDLLALHMAMDRLAALDERQARVVELKFFGGLSNEAVGEVLGLSLATVKREWRTAKAWLLSELQQDSSK